VVAIAASSLEAPATATAAATASSAPTAGDCVSDSGCSPRQHPESKQQRTPCWQSPGQVRLPPSPEPAVPAAAAAAAAGNAVNTGTAYQRNSEYDGNRAVPHLGRTTGKHASFSPAPHRLTQHYDELGLKVGKTHSIMMSCVGHGAVSRRVGPARRQFGPGRAGRHALTRA
jgi:hypothetical protein